MNQLKKKNTGCDFYLYISEFFLEDQEIFNARSIYIDLIENGFNESDAFQITIGKLL